MNTNKKKGGFRGAKKKSWKETSKIPDVINYNKMEKKGLLNENAEIVTNSLVKRVISVINDKKVNKKVEPRLDSLKPKRIDINVLDPKSNKIPQDWAGKSVLLRDGTNSAEWQILTVASNKIRPKSDDLAPRYRNRQERKHRKPREPRKPREKRELRLKKEPWEYEGKSFLNKYNEKK